MTACRAALAGCVILAVAAGCGGRRQAVTRITARGAAATHGPEALTVRVGYFPNITHAPAVLGFSAARSRFAEALAGRATLDTKVFNAGPSAMESLHARAIDLCFVGPTPAINAYAKGGDVVLVSNVANGGSVLVARPDVGVAGVADLAGKRVAVPQIGNTQDAMLRMLLLEAGIQTADKGGTTSVVAVDNPDVLALFQTKQLDAACVPEPWGARLESEAGAKVVLDWRAIWRDGDYPVTVLVARKEFLEQHREIVEAFVEALAGEADYASTDPGALAALNAELEVLTKKKLPEDVLKEAMERVRFSPVPNPEALQAMADLMHQVGYAKEAIDIAGLVDLSVAKPAATEERSSK